jgi:hypothetical protein
VPPPEPPLRIRSADPCSAVLVRNDAEQCSALRGQPQICASGKSAHYQIKLADPFPCDTDPLSFVLVFFPALRYNGFDKTERIRPPPALKEESP